MSDNLDTDSDLRDVFSLLYADEDWTFDDGEDEDKTGTTGSHSKAGEDSIHPPLDSVMVIPEEVDVVDNALSAPATASEEQEEPEIDTRVIYTRKRFFDALDSLFLPLSASAPAVHGSRHAHLENSVKSADDTKRRRIYPSRPSPSPSLILSNQPVPALPAAKSYAPFSPLALLGRLRTYQPHTYSPLYPESLHPVEAALNGWINDGPQSLSCGACKSRWSLAGVGDIVNERVREEVAKRLSAGFAQRHAKSCPWKIRSSPESLQTSLLKLLHPGISSNLVPLSQALSCEIPSNTLSHLNYTSPLSSKQEESFYSSISLHTSSAASSAPPSSAEQEVGNLSLVSVSIAPIATLLALFGWYPYYPNEPSDHITPRPSNQTTDLGAGQVTTESTSAEKDSTPGRDIISEKTERRKGDVGQTDIVRCRICERRIGLWAFITSSDSKSTTKPNADISGDARHAFHNEVDRAFNLVEEHLGWCPIRSAETEKTGGTIKAWWESNTLLQSRQDSSSITTDIGARPQAGLITTAEENSGTGTRPTGITSTDPQRGAGALAGAGFHKGWVAISEKLEKKPWRRIR